MIDSESRRRIYAIARWEFISRTRTRTFVVSLILAPIMVANAIILPTLFFETQQKSTSIIGFVDFTDSVFAPARAWTEAHDHLPGGGVAYRLVRYSDLRSADSASFVGATSATVVVTDSAGSVRAFYRSETPGHFRAVAAMERAVTRAVRDRRLRDAGIDTAAFARLSPTIPMTTVQITPDGEEGVVSRLELVIATVVMAELLSFTVLLSVGTMVRSLLEEKSNRIMEILLTSGRSIELMWGKLIGLSAIGLIETAAWLGVGIAAARLFAGPSVVSRQLERFDEVIPVLMAFYVVGFLLYSSISIGLGSLASSEEEADRTQGWVYRLLGIPGMIAAALIVNPDAGWVRVLSYVPLFTPPLMMARSVNHMPSTIEFATTLVILVIATVFAVWASAKVFSTAILLTGKRPGISEVWRWIRER